MAEPQVLDTARKYYDWVLTEQYNEFFSNDANFRNLINLASSLFHFHEWLYAEFPNDLHIMLNSPQPFNSKGAFWGAVESTNQNFGFIRDIANSSKHVRLTKNSTSITHMANTIIQGATWGNAQWGNSKWDAQYATSKDGPRDVLFDKCAEELFVYWTNLIDNLS